MTNGFHPSPEQRWIIEYQHMSLRVAAGAGTGKTTTIVERIAHLVREGLDPVRVLGVTFTNKAADELNQRVIDSLEINESANTPEISTYHSFAASILDEFGAYVGFRRSSRLIDDGHRNEVANRVLSNLDSSVLDLASFSKRRGELLTLSSAITDNLIDSDAIKDADSWPKVEVWEERDALLKAVLLFSEEKERLSLIEYGDLIRLAVKVVEEFPDVAKEIGSRYDAVVLDEYQDTDPAQRRLLTTLFSGRVPVIAVGDTDQTIYEWRGASAENFEAFPTDFPHSDGSAAETAPLSLNRRSGEDILDLANIIREKIPHIEGALPLSPAEGAGNGEIVTSWFNTDVTEAEWIAQEITLRHTAGVQWKDVAILCRKRSNFKEIVRALNIEGVPFTVASMGDLLEVPEIADLHAWLNVLNNQRDEKSILRILLGGKFRLGMAAVASLRKWCSEADGSTLFDAAVSNRNVEGLTQEAVNRIDDFLAIHRELMMLSQVTNVPGVIDAVVDKLGFWDEIAALDEGRGLTARLNLGKFTDLAEQWHPIDGSPTLSKFLSYLTAMSESDRAEELAAAILSDANAVSVMTIHSAKGLEWRHVYIPSVAKRVFPSQTKVFDNPDARVDRLPYEMRLNRENYAQAAAASSKERIEILRSMDNEQEWRVAYVAVTRAAERLVITGHAWDNEIKKPREPSELWKMANELVTSVEGVYETISNYNPGSPPFEIPALPPDPLFTEGPAAALRRSISQPEWIETNYPELSDAVRERVTQLKLSMGDLAEPVAVEPERKFTVSVTNLVTLAHCPQKFSWIHYDKLPRRPRISAKLGTDLHRRIELHNLGVIALDEPSSESYDEVSSEPEDQEMRSDSSKPWRVFCKSRYFNETPILTEAPFEIPVGDGSIRGKVDAIYEHEDGEWEIVDYKSGRDREDDSRFVQLEAYAIAAAEGALSNTPPVKMKVTFAYFGGGELTEVTENVDDEWLSNAERHVSGLIDVGISGPYTPRPSNKCRWCDFLHICPVGQEEVEGS